MSCLPPDDELDGMYGHDGKYVKGLLAPWHPTDDARIQASLSAMKLQPSDLLLELGCGDGKICGVAAEKFGCRSIGVELDESMVEKARQKMGGLPSSCRDLVEIRQGDLLDMHLAEVPTCVTLYLMPDFYEKLEPLLEHYISTGAKLVVYAWALKGERWDRRLLQEGDHWWLYQGEAA
eukprot:TRINITY_DN23456_c0_g1_i1.p1 TRINITY_DN23456_c0_g1~~TRINITY_DN23456_c0_g1_i1.p1  ORF type:complete len:178 (-),score=31.67 TRINITY_DN23456_c0_g1_i1:44-577(-)